MNVAASNSKNKRKDRLEANNMTNRTQKGGLQVAGILIDLVADKIAPGTGVDA